MRNPELWARLEAHSFDGTGSAPYSVKLARAQGWNAAFTARVIEEYRRFLYLTQVSAHQVTPSRAVDAAWHTHLTFTRDYWDVLCPNVIGRAVHHQPCAGDEEMPRYRNQFAATKALYEAEFGHEPPRSVWGGQGRKMSILRLAQAEAGGAAINTETLMLVAIAGCVGLYFAEANVHWMVYGLIILAAYLLGGVIEKATGGRRRKKRRRERNGEWIEGGGGEGDSTSGGGRNTQGTDSKTSTGKGFWANMFDGDGDGGGCGGCGGCGGD